MRSVTESNHAQEHWLRLSVRPVVDRALKAHSLEGDATVDDLIDQAVVMCEKSGDWRYASSWRLERIECAISYLLRAAAAFRRDESRKYPDTDSE